MSGAASGHLSAPACPALTRRAAWGFTPAFVATVQRDRCMGIAEASHRCRRPPRILRGIVKPPSMRTDTASLRTV